MNAGTVSIHGPSPGLSKQAISSPSQSGGIAIPITVYAKLYLNNSEPSFDIGTIEIPSNIKRWRLTGLVTQIILGGHSVVVESPVDGTIACYDAPNGSGTQLTQFTTFTSFFGAGTLYPMALFSNNLSISNKIYVNLFQAGSMSGYISVYLTIYPLP